MIIKNRNGEFQYIDRLLQLSELTQENYHNELFLKYTEKYLHLLRNPSNQDDNSLKQSNILNLMVKTIEDNPSNIKDFVNHLMVTKKPVLSELNKTLNLFSFLANHQEYLTSIFQLSNEKGRFINLLNSLYVHFLQQHIMVDNKGFKSIFLEDSITLEYNNSLEVYTNIDYNEKMQKFMVNLEFNLELCPFSVYRYSINDDAFGMFAENFLFSVLPTLLYKSYTFYNRVLNASTKTFKVSRKDINEENEYIGSILNFTISIPFETKYFGNKYYDVFYEMEKIVKSYKNYLQHSFKFISTSHRNLEFFLHDTYDDFEDWEKYEEELRKKNEDYLDTLDNIKNPLLKSIILSIEMTIQREIRIITYEMSRAKSMGSMSNYDFGYNV